jgi:hypothetical protein
MDMSKGTLHWPSQLFNNTQALFSRARLYRKCKCDASKIHVSILRPLKIKPNIKRSAGFHVTMNQFLLLSLCY